MSNVRWKDKAAIVVAAGDKMPITDITDNTDKHVTPALLAAYTLGGRTIADGTAGAIATIDASQTFINKRINGLALNSAVAITTDSAEINLLDGLTADATELNKLDGLATSKTELGYVTGVTSAIQTQLNDLSAAAGALSSRVFSYGVTFVAAGTSADEITQATIMTGAGVPSGYIINPIYVYCGVILKSCTTKSPNSIH